VTVELDRKGFCCAGDRLKRNSESNACAKGWTGNRMNKCAALTDVTTAAFALLMISFFVRPPKHNRSLQRETYRFSSPAYKTHIHLQ
jgi:hypothetical protein